MAITISPKSLRFSRKGAASRAMLWWGGAAVLAVATITGVQLLAQIEGDRGIAPLANSQDIQVNGISVDVTAKTGAQARIDGWKLAEKEAWKKLGGPDMPTESIDAMVTSVVIGHEQVGPKRYIATLGVIFDKAKAGQYVGAGAGSGPRSAPLLLIPMLDSGGVRQVFEVRGPWQRAWAEFQAAASPVDYVRPTGSGGESLILTAGQTSRRSRLWWRTVLGQFDASDVVMPVARLERQWPGGPIKGTFTARYGPDNSLIGSVTLRASNASGIAQMLDEGARRIDELYIRALNDGRLRPDPSLIIEEPVDPDALAIENAADAVVETVDLPTMTSTTGTTSFAIQFDTPDVGSIGAGESTVRAIPGVRSASTSSLALGGTSVMQVSFEGTVDMLRNGLQARGYNVTVSGTTLRITRRQAPQPPQ